MQYTEELVRIELLVLRISSVQSVYGIDESSYNTPGTGEATKITKQWLGSILVWNSITSAR